MASRTFVAAALLLSFDVAAQSIGTLSFSPAHPASSDSITVILAPAAIDFCPVRVNVDGNSVGIFSSPGSCSGQGTTNRIVIGQLAPGNYQVSWEFPDDFFHNGATGMLAVAAAPEGIPALSLAAFAMLAVTVLTLGLLFLPKRAATRRGR